MREQIFSGEWKVPTELPLREKVLGYQDDNDFYNDCPLLKCYTYLLNRHSLRDHPRSFVLILLLNYQTRAHLDESGYLPRYSKFKDLTNPHLSAQDTQEGKITTRRSCEVNSCTSCFSMLYDYTAPVYGNC
jgi:hypothetical protein